MSFSFGQCLGVFGEGKEEEVDWYGTHDGHKALDEEEPPPALHAGDTIELVTISMCLEVNVCRQIGS